MNAVVRRIAAAIVVMGPVLIFEKDEAAMLERSEVGLEEALVVELGKTSLL